MNTVCKVLKQLNRVFKDEDLETKISSEMRWSNIKYILEYSIANIVSIQSILSDDNIDIKLPKDCKCLPFAEEFVHKIETYISFLDATCDLNTVCQMPKSTIADAAEQWLCLQLPQDEESRKVEVRREYVLTIYSLVASVLHSAQKLTGEQISRVEEFLINKLNAEGLDSFNAYSNDESIFNTLNQKENLTAKKYWIFTKRSDGDLANLALKLLTIPASITTNFADIFNIIKINALKPDKLRKLFAVYYHLKEKKEEAYIKMVRQALAEQLSISKELTQKLNKEDDSDEDIGDEPLVPVTSDKENAWMYHVKTEPEVSTFLINYRKYWEKEHQKEIIENNANQDPSGNKNPAINVFEENSIEQNDVNEDNESESEEKTLPSTKQKKKLQKSSKDKLGIKSPKSKITKVKKSKVKAGTSVWSVSPANSVESESNDVKSSGKHDLIDTENFDIDDMFDSVEDKIKENTNKKIKILKSEISQERNNERKKKKKKKQQKKEDVVEEVRKLGLKGQKNVRPSIPKPIEESTGSEPSSNLPEIERTINFPHVDKGATSQTKKDVVIMEDKCPKIKKHLVNDLSFPFTSVEDYEASIRAPIGRDFVPEKTFSKLITPPVKTKVGQIIEPMTEDALVKINGLLKKRKVSDVKVELGKGIITKGKKNSKSKAVLKTQKSVKEAAK